MPLSVSFQSTPTVSAAERKAGPQFQRQAVDYRLRLPKGWMATFDPCDQSWVGRSLFVSKENMRANNVNWWMHHHCSIPLQHAAMPTVDSYFAHRLFLWMPRKMWGMALFCHVGSHNCRHRVHRWQSARSRSACDEASEYRWMVFRVLRWVL